MHIIAGGVSYKLFVVVILTKEGGFGLLAVFPPLSTYYVLSSWDIRSLQQADLYEFIMSALKEENH